MKLLRKYLSSFGRGAKYGRNVKNLQIDHGNRNGSGDLDSPNDLGAFYEFYIMNGPQTYFSTLSNDLLTVLIFQIENATPSMLFSTPLITAAKSLFHTVIFRTDAPLTAQPTYGTILFGGGKRCAASVPEVENVLRIIGDSVKRICLSLYDETTDYTRFITPLLKYCNCVESLDFDNLARLSDVAQFLTRYAGNLTYLSFSVGNTASTSNFPIDSFPKLRIFSHFRGNLSTFSSVWRTSGAELREVTLSIWDSDNFHSVVNDMHPFCPNLNRLILCSSEGVIPKQEHVKLLSSYGEQLVEACLEMLDAEHLEQLAINCPNLRCEFDERFGRVDRISASAPIISILRLYWDVRKDALLADSLSRCHHVQELNVQNANADLKSIFTASFPSLEVLYLAPTLSEDDVKLIAQYTGRLKSIGFNWDPVIHASNVRPLASSNCLTLEQMSIFLLAEWKDRQKSLKWTSDLVEPFSTKCGRFRSFQLTSNWIWPERSALRTLLLPLRRRGIECFVFFNDNNSVLAYMEG